MSLTKGAFFGALLALAAAGVLGWWSLRAVESHAPTTEPEPEAQPAVAVVERRQVPDVPPAGAPQLAPPASPFAARNNEAVAFLERGELEPAIALLEACVEGQPEEPAFRSNLAEALVRRAVAQHELTRPCEPCIEWLERALTLAPERSSLASLRDRWRAEVEAEQEFVRDRSVHFELGYDSERGALLDSAPDVLERLELHYIDFAEIFGAHPGELGEPRIPVVLYRVEQFTRITGLDWAGGSYDGTIRVPLAEGRGLDASLSELLRHELVHAFVRHLGGARVPAWLNEGLAQLFQTDAALELARARARLARGAAIVAWSELDRPFSHLGDVERIATAYAQSLVLCDYVERSFGRETLVRMVRGCAGGSGPAEAFESWTRLPLATMFADFAQTLER